MTSKVQLCSNASLLIGCDPIANLNEATDRATLMANIYDQTRQAALRCYPWNCAKVVVLLSPDVTAPASPSWKYQFSLPGDCLRVLAVGEEGDHPPFRVIGRKIVANCASLLLEYIVDLTDENAFDTLLTDYLCSRLAFTAAYPLTKDTAMRKAMAVLMESNLRDARLVDSQEEPPEEFQGSAIMRARRSSALGNNDGM